MDERDPLIRGLGEVNPVPPGRTAGAHESPDAVDLLARIPDSVGRSRRARRVAAALVLVVVLAALATVVLVRQEGPATATELLRDASMVAADQPHEASLGRYLYMRTRVQQLVVAGPQGDAWSYVLPIDEETWIAPDGSGRVRSVFGPVRFLGPRDQQRWEAAGSPELAGGESDDVLPEGSLTYEDLGQLPTDPTSLRAQLVEDVEAEGLPVNVGVFLRIAELLARGDAGPDLRSSLYEVVAQLPGVELAGEVIDPVGRPGVGVAMSYRQAGTPLRALMIFDEQTTELLAQERILVERAPWVDADPGTLLSSIAYLESARTSVLDDTT